MLPMGMCPKMHNKFAKDLKVVNLENGFFKIASLKILGHFFR